MSLHFCKVAAAGFCRGPATGCSRGPVTRNSRGPAMRTSRGPATGFYRGPATGCSTWDPVETFVQFPPSLSYNNASSHQPPRQRRLLTKTPSLSLKNRKFSGSQKESKFVKHSPGHDWQHTMMKNVSTQPLIIHMESIWN